MMGPLKKLTALTLALLLLFALAVPSFAEGAKTFGSVLSAFLSEYAQSIGSLYYDGSASSMPSGATKAAIEETYNITLTQFGRSDELTEGSFMNYVEPTGGMMTPSIDISLTPATASGANTVSFYYVFSINDEDLLDFCDDLSEDESLDAAGRVDALIGYFEENNVRVEYKYPDGSVAELIGNTSNAVLSWEEYCNQAGSSFFGSFYSSGSAHLPIWALLLDAAGAPGFYDSFFVIPDGNADGTLRDPLYVTQDLPYTLSDLLGELAPKESCAISLYPPDSALLGAISSAYTTNIKSFPNATDPIDKSSDIGWKNPIANALAPSVDLKIKTLNDENLLGIQYRWLLNNAEILSAMKNSSSYEELADAFDALDFRIEYERDDKTIVLVGKNGVMSWKDALTNGTVYSSLSTTTYLYCYFILLDLDDDASVVNDTIVVPDGKKDGILSDPLWLMLGRGGLSPIPGGTFTPDVPSVGTPWNIYSTDGYDYQPATGDASAMPYSLLLAAMATLALAFVALKKKV